MVAPSVSEQELSALADEAGAELEGLERALSSFNIFVVMRSVHGEVRHSNVLAWLLTPTQSHGLGDAFLRAWLKSVVGGSSVAVPFTETEVDAAVFRSVQVQREWAHIDVLLRLHLESGEEWVIAIENKVHAGQGDGQLARYRSRLETAFATARRLLVFLTLDDLAPDDEGWTTAHHAGVAAVLSACLEAQIDRVDADVLVFINHYLKVLGGHLVSDEKLVQLAHDIYARHRRALDFVFEHRVDVDEEVTNAVERRMRASTAEHGLVPMKCGKGYVRFLPAALNTEANLRGTAWGEGQSAYLLCELVLRDNRATLKIVEGVAPPAWRAGLHSLALANKGLFTVQSKIPSQWMSVYQHQVPRPLEALGSEKVAEATWEACLGTVLHDADFKKACAMLRAHVDKL